MTIQHMITVLPGGTAGGKNIEWKTLNTSAAKNDDLLPIWASG